MNPRAFSAKLLSLRRFSLRTGLIAFVTLSIGMGLLGRWVQSVRDRGEAQRWLIEHSAHNANRRSLGVNCFTRKETQVPWATTLIRKWVHPLYNVKFETIVIHSTEATNEEVADRIEKVFGVDHLTIHSPESAASLRGMLTAAELKSLCILGPLDLVFNDRDRVRVQLSRSIESIEIQDMAELPESLSRQFCNLPRLTKITLERDSPQNLINLAKAPRLEHFAVYDYSTNPKRIPRSWMPLLQQLDADEVNVMRRMFDELSNRQHLKTLELHNLWLDDPSIVEEFCEKSNVDTVYLPGTKLSPECFRQFSKLKHLRKLEVQAGRLKEPHLAILTKMGSLKSLDLIDTYTREKNTLVDDLKTAMPWCAIQSR